MANRPAEVVRYTTPPAFELLSKTAKVLRTDTTAFDGFVIPKFAVIAGVYVMGATASNAGTTAVIQAGSNPGTTNEILASYDVKGAGAGYFPAGATAGTSIGSQLTADLLVKLKYVESGTASTAGGPWLVKVEYYYPQQGESW